MLDPVVIKVGTIDSQKKSRWHWPTFLLKWSKLITGTAAVVIGGTIIFIGISTITVNKESFKQDHNINSNGANDTDPSSGSEPFANALPGGGTATGIGGTTGTNSPVVTLTADPASVKKGGSVTLSWTVTNNPTECTASEDWSGTKGTSGQEKLSNLSIIQTYIYTLTCKTATGTGFSTVSVSVVEQGGSGDVAKRPTVSLSANPTSMYAGDSSTITWSATNNPTSCTASGDWSGLKSASGAETTGSLATVKSYSYTLKCSNSAGEGYATTTLEVLQPPADLPIVLLASNPVGPITPGTSVTLQWSVSNGTPDSCTATGDWSGSKNVGGGSESMGALSSIKTYSYTISCQNSAGSTNDTAAILVLPNPPVVSLLVNPTSIYAGSNATITWSASNSPTSCTATGDWSGTKAASGSLSTGNLTSTGTYYYSLSCTNSGGTGFVNNVALSVTNPPAPVVSISSSPISIASGSSSTITWSATNNPTGCTASGDWSGSKSSSGTQSTGTLSTARTYTYTLACTNSGGTSTSSTTVDVTSGGGGATAPIISISLSPTSIGTGSSSTISWSATNSPTSCTASNGWSGSKSAAGSQSTGAMNVAGTFTYTLQCTNSAGSDTKSATLTVIAIPVVTITVSPNSITAGSSSTISWSATNSPTSCNAGGSWSGSKAASGSQSTGVMNTAGTYNFSLACTNSGGTGSNNVNLTVSSAAPVYCGGLTPCYGVSEMAARAVTGNCWAWNTGTSTWPWVINITSFRPNHPGGARSGTLEEPTSVCNHNINSILGGSASIPSFKDSSNASTHNHASATKNNTGSSQLSSYRTGYYDATKP